MKKVIVLALMVLCYSHSQAQVFGPVPTGSAAAPENNLFANAHQRWTPMMQKLFQQVKNDDEFITHYVGAEVGSPYENENFDKGKVYYDDELLGDFYYRYNIFSNEIEVKRTDLKEEKHKALIPDPKVLLITSNGQKMQILGFKPEKGKSEEGYLRLLFEGSDYKLYKHLRVKFTEAKAAENSMVNATPSRFTNYIEYYYTRGAEKEAISIPLKKAKFLKSFSSKKNGTLKDFLKKENLDLNNENHLIQVFRFLDN